MVVRNVDAIRRIALLLLVFVSLQVAHHLTQIHVLRLLLLLLLLLIAR